MCHPDRWFVHTELPPEQCMPPDGSRCDTIMLSQSPFIEWPLQVWFITTTAAMEGIAPILTRLRAHEEAESVATSALTSASESGFRQEIRTTKSRGIAFGVR